MTGSKGAGDTAPGSADGPDYAVYDGHGFTIEVAEPAYLWAWTTTDLDSGRSWRSVYRSVLVEDDDALYRPVRELIGDAEPLKSEVLPDESMMFGEAELSVYAI